MDAYNIQCVATCNEPLLKNVDATYILTLESSKRVIDKNITNLSKVTYVQTNQGFRKCPKPGVDSSSRDIVHAVQNVCINTRHLSNVLVLEDDAEMMPTCTKRRSFSQVDSFLSRHSGIVFSLGSFGFVIPASCTIRKFVGFMGFAQAVIYSQAVRNELENVNVEEVKHIDAHFLSRHPCYTHALPLVVQKFPNTDNMKEWSITGGAVRGWVEGCLVRCFIFIMQNVLCLRCCTYGWFFIYLVNHLLYVIPVAFAVFVVMAVLM